ncbi:KCTD1_15 [Mytilus coruscus]|uniref:KCTD1_15 n=1 Tax=Mytilus coruscus TaxID=42192 RepID=A0A6J8AAH5_MYTCO|nr:KCTD1_15 [Mytilus coruscus]
MSANTTAAGREGERFGTAEDDDIDDLMNDVLAKNTQKSTKFAVKLVYDYCVSKGVDANIEDRSPASLNNLLKEFYVNLRQANGDFYSRSSFCVIRESIYRHLKQPPYNKPFDIISDTEFTTAINVFKAMCKKLRKEGRGQIKHKKSVAKGDIKKLYEHLRAFNVNSPSGLLSKVWFEVLLYFCRRGQENLREMKPSDFQISEDDEGKEYVHKISSEVTKTHQGVEEENFEPELGRMYATGTPMCPVLSFKKYLRKLNQNQTAFWQRPRDSFNEEDDIWYENKPLGKNTLGSMMKTISQSANLCKTYTNHCVRATCKTVLIDSGFEARHIVTISDHRNEQSVQNCVLDTSTAQKRDMSASISSYIDANSTTNLDQNNNNENMNNSIFDVNESDLTEAQYDNIFESIQQGEAELHPLSDITNRNPLAQNTGMNKHPIVFNNCNDTIHNIS